MKKEHPIWHSFVRSNYITAVWNWFLMLAGKAAEAVLTASVVYSCARLLPAVHPPVGLDNSVFVAQMVALDVGGLSLRKLANQARKDGNESGARFAGRVSTALISIMVANVALSVIQAITPISAQFIAVVEGMLLVGRAIMAVLYAHVIHSLRDDSPLSEQAAPTQSSEIQQIAARVEELASMIQPVSYDVLMEQLNTRITEAVKQTEQQAKQSVSLPEPVSPKHETPPRETANSVSRNTRRNTKKIVPLPPRETGQNTREVVYRLLDEDETRGPRELGRLANIAPATAKRHRDAYFAERDETPTTKQSAM